MEQRTFDDVGLDVEIAVTQVNYTLEGGDEEPVIHIFGRTAGQDTVHARVYGFDPYFYAASGSVTDRSVNEADGLTMWESVDKESIRGASVARLYGETPRDVGQARSNFDHYEADVPFPTRFLVDKDIESGVRLPLRTDHHGVIQAHHTEVEPVDAPIVDARVCFFDIEVDDRNGFPEDGDEEIICIASHDSYDDEYVLWLLDAPQCEDPPDAIRGYDSISGDDLDCRIEAFDEESAMLDSFLEYLDETDPDILSGWNFDDFDVPYFFDRLETIDGDVSENLDPDRLSRVNEVWHDDWNGPNIKGRVVFDLLYAYERTQFTELDSYRLDAIGEEELGVGKERYTGDIGDLWEQDPERLLEYNLRDVELCVELNRSESIIPFWNEVSSFVGCKLEDSTTPGDAVDVYVLQKLTDKFALPTKGSAEYEDYEGGAVFDPITGVKENVATLDLASLYPMCMVTVNASPETKVDPDSYDGETFVSPNGSHFQKEPDGVIREMVDELLQEREDKKALRDDHDPDSDAYARYDRQQRAVKVIMNSLYGTLGWERFRLYDKEIGEAVTAAGRAVVRHTADVAEDLGYEVAYGDTDSVLLEVLPGDYGNIEISDDLREKHPDMDDDDIRQILSIVEQCFDLEDDINASYDEFAREQMNAESHRFDIEFEKLYRKFLQAGKKKRYAGHVVWKERKHVDNVDITGFEYQRSSSAPVTRRVQEKTIRMIVKDDASVDEVENYIRDEVDDLLDGGYGLDDVGMPSGIGRSIGNYLTPTAHVRGAKYSNLVLGTNFRSGSKPKRVYLGRVRPSFFDRVEETPGFDVEDNPLYAEFKRNPDVICFDYPDEVPDEFEVDWEKMLGKLLEGPIEGVVRAIDLDWDDITEDRNQTTMEAFA